MKMNRFLGIIFGLVIGTSTILSQARAEEKNECIKPKKVKESYNYISLGAGPLPLLLPSFGLGHRYQKKHNGFDISLNVTTIVAITQLKGNLLYLYYPKPNPKSQFYTGFGLGAGAIFAKDISITRCNHELINLPRSNHWYKNCLARFSPELVFGKKYTTNTNNTRFFQAQISWPTVFTKDVHHTNFCKNKTVSYYPEVVFSYGIGF